MRKIEGQTTSNALANGIDHHKGDVEGLIVDLVHEWFGPYERAEKAHTWPEKQSIFNRNAMRKQIRENMENWMGSHGRTGDESQRRDNRPGPGAQAAMGAEASRDA